MQFTLFSYSVEVKCTNCKKEVDLIIACSFYLKMNKSTLSLEHLSEGGVRSHQYLLLLKEGNIDCLFTSSKVSI
jgi:hypothetical protein